MKESQNAGAVYLAVSRSWREVGSLARSNLWNGGQHIELEDTVIQNSLG